MKLEIVSWSDLGIDCGAWEWTEVLLDGKQIALESYGGEPEDNRRCRDYRWVEPLLMRLAKLNVDEVVLTKREGSPYDDE